MLSTNVVPINSTSLSELSFSEIPSQVDYLDLLEKEALTHRAVNHPYLESLAQGQVPHLEKALQDFAYHYGHYSNYFPRYLTLTLSKLNNPLHRASLLENLTEESGLLDPEKTQALLEAGIDLKWVEGIPHPTLFQRFVKSLGSRDTRRQEEAMEAICWRETVLSILASADEAEAIGILGLGTEHIVKHIYPYLINAIKLHGKISRQDAIFFELHCLVDDDHAQSLRRIASDFAQTEEGKKRLRIGMLKALNSRAAFWDSLLERALSL